MTLLDTHAWVFLVSGMALSERAKEAIEAAAAIGISAISCWEVALLAEKGRLVLTTDVSTWISDALKYPGLQCIDLTATILVNSVLLPDLHQDPADRMIAATCYLNQWPLITKDQRLRNWPAIETIW